MSVTYNEIVFSNVLGLGGHQRHSSAAADAASVAPSEADRRRGGGKINGLLGIGEVESERG